MFMLCKTIVSVFKLFFFDNLLIRFLRFSGKLLISKVFFVGVRIVKTSPRWKNCHNWFLMDVVSCGLKCVRLIDYFERTWCYVSDNSFSTTQYIKPTEKMTFIVRTVLQCWYQINTLEQRFRIILLRMKFINHRQILSRLHLVWFECTFVLLTIFFLILGELLFAQTEFKTLADWSFNIFCKSLYNSLPY